MTAVGVCFEDIRIHIKSYGLEEVGEQTDEGTGCWSRLVKGAKRTRANQTNKYQFH